MVCDRWFWEIALVFVTPNANIKKRVLYISSNVSSSHIWPYVITRKKMFSLFMDCKWGSSSISLCTRITGHVTEIHRSLQRKIEKILNRPITKFYNSDDVNTLRQNFGKLKRGQFLFKWYIIFCMRQKMTGGDKI